MLRCIISYYSFYSLENISAFQNALFQRQVLDQDLNANWTSAKLQKAEGKFAKSSHYLRFVFPVPSKNHNKVREIYFTRSQNSHISQSRKMYFSLRPINGKTPSDEEHQITAIKNWTCWQLTDTPVATHCLLTHQFKITPFNTLPHRFLKCGGGA